MHSRDDFSTKTKEDLGRRTGFLCSNPECQAATVGPQAVGHGTINIGVAAHIVAAAQGPGAKRRDKNKSPDERKSPDNGIWLCQNCAKLIDSDEGRFTVSILHGWKRDAEQQALARVGNKASGERVALVQALASPIAAATPGLDAFRNAAIDDAKGFRAAAQLPSDAMAPRLLAAAGTLSQSLTIEAAATAIAATTGAILLAPPGTGKSTTLLLLTEHIHATCNSISVLVPLSEWAVNDLRLFEFLLRRARFTRFLLEHVTQLACSGRLILMLDGWNEISGLQRTRLECELTQLRRDYPQLVTVLASRPGKDHPSYASRLGIAPLTSEHQRAIARGISGELGERKLDEAQSIPGLSELVAIPLYLNAIIKADGPLPASKEQVVSHFMEQQLMSPSPRSVSVVTRGLHLDYLKEIGKAIQVAGTIVLSEKDARAAINRASRRLAAEGQLTAPPEPVDVLTALTDQHILVRTSDGAGIHFQHQQFQEWHASFAVEDLVRENSAGGLSAGHRLWDEILNYGHWDEPVLFAAERISRTEPVAAAALISIALGVAPMLAAELIARCGEAVWGLVMLDAIELVNRWSMGKLKQRALSFMLISGRADFSARTWPQLVATDSSTQLNALRSAPILRMTALASDAQTKISKLSGHVRSNLLSELSDHGDAAARTFAVRVAAADVDVAVRFGVLQTCCLSGHTTAVRDLMTSASSGFWEHVARHGELLPAVGGDIHLRLVSITKDLVTREADLAKRLRLLLDLYPDHCEAAPIISLLEDPDYPIDSDAIPFFVRRSPDFARLLREALQTRVRKGFAVPYYATHYLAGSRLIDDPDLERLVIDTPTETRHATVAASLMGPQSLTRVVAAYLAMDDAVEALPRHLRSDPWSRLRAVEDRIIGSDLGAFSVALCSFKDDQNLNHIDALARLIERHGDRNSSREPLTGSTGAVGSVVESLKRLARSTLQNNSASRHQLAQVARAIGRTSAPELASELFELLDADTVRREHIESGEQCRRPNERHPELGIDRGHFWSAFVNIGSDAVKERLQTYLADLNFGVHAANAIREMDGDQSMRSRRPARGDGPALDAAMENRVLRQRGTLPAPIPSALAMWTIAERYAASDDAAKQHHALMVATVMMTLPHRDMPRLPEMLRREPILDTRVKALAAMAAAGHILDGNLLNAGLAALYEQATDICWKWMLDPKSEKIVPWLELYPFSDRPEDLLPQVQKCGSAMPPSWQLIRVAISLGIVGGAASFATLVELAAVNEDLWAHPEWQRALIACDPAEGLRTMIRHLTPSTDTCSRAPKREWQLGQLLKITVQANHVAKNVLLDLYQETTERDVLNFLEGSLAEIGGPDVLRAIIFRRTVLKQGYGPHVATALRSVVLEFRPIGNSNAYETFGRDATILRRELFTLAEAGSQLAHECLLKIDALRDEHGAVHNEPRHPNSFSHTPWPKP